MIRYIYIKEDSNKAYWKSLNRYDEQPLARINVAMCLIFLLFIGISSTSTLLFIFSLCYQCREGTIGNPLKRSYRICRCCYRRLGKKLITVGHLLFSLMYQHIISRNQLLYCKEEQIISYPPVDSDFFYRRSNLFTVGTYFFT